MEHRRRRNDATVGEHPLNNHQVVGPVVLLKVVTAVAREALGILFHMQMLRIVKMKVSAWNQKCNVAIDAVEDGYLEQLERFGTFYDNLRLT